MEVPLQSGNTLRWTQVPWIKRFITKQHTNQHCRDKLDIKLQMKANACIWWWLLNLHLVYVRFSGYWWIKCVIGGCANTKAKMVISNKVFFSPIYYPNLSRNYLLHLIWYTNIFYTSELKLSDILSDFSCRNMILTLPSLKSHQSTSLAIQSFLNIYVHEDSYLLGCWRCVSQ